MNNEIKFWSLVDKNDPSGCWLYKGFLDRDGYGIFTTALSQDRAHRYVLKNNTDIKGKVVCHKCDVRNCVNPDHLFVGSQADNIKDMISKNRHHHNRSRKSTPRKVTDEMINEILTSTLPKIHLAKKLGINKTTVYRILKQCG